MPAARSHEHRSWAHVTVALPQHTDAWDKHLCAVRIHSDAGRWHSSPPFLVEHSVDNLPWPTTPPTVCYIWAGEVPPSIYLAFMYTSYGLIARKILAGMPLLDNAVREVYSTGHS